MSFWTIISRKRGVGAGHHARLALLRRCAVGEVPGLIVLMKLAAITKDRGEMESLIRMALAANSAGSAGERRLQDLMGLLVAHRDVHGVVRRINAALAARRLEASDAEHWSAVFDSAVKISPEASVALYSLGDPGLLRLVTDELVEKLSDWQMLEPKTRVLDFGCGIGRVAWEVAPRVRALVAADISTGMLQEARSRLRGLENVRVTAVDDLEIENSAFDLMLLIDVCPYLPDARPVLRGLLSGLASDGNLIVMNWSYDIAPAEQRALARDFAREQGLALVREGTAEFTMWDGLVFHFHKAA